MTTTALVTGANRGIGRALAAELLDRGAKVYATARRPDSIDLPGAEILALDVTDPRAVADAARQAGDVDLLVNNAGIGAGGTFLGDLDAVRAEMDVNFWGTLSMIRAFVPVLEANGGGAVLNIASAASWFPMPGATGYGASKAAMWSLANGLRHELAGKDVLVTSVHLGLADTDLTKGLDLPKNPASVVAKAALDGVEAGAYEVIVDDIAALFKSSAAHDPREFYDRLATLL
ncbi:SDR family oxidoreductase [Kineosporia sp. J2-2]|uniref:SDR family oxidoreductase n=1 Tax=Kineosporia corallincola TaxID=2835133 RepID=A0ABS5TG34_9ACTN|nr:SDR family oxidoreductase [Kineosporia corallincola]MBT0770056.1 SDR family oxidoreductase [Kineosporia corallincola]